MKNTKNYIELYKILKNTKEGIFFTSTLRAEHTEDQ